MVILFFYTLGIGGSNMNKLLLAPVLLVGSLLGGCELDNDSMKSIIEECKNDEECMEIINQEVDAVLAERGVVTWDDYDAEFYDEDWEDYEWLEDLTDEELAMWETVEDLEKEYFEALEGMSAEEFAGLFGDVTEEQLEAIHAVYELEFGMSEADYLAMEIGREVTESEMASIELVEELYESIDWDQKINEDYDTEAEFLEAMLGRTLSTDELAAVEVVEALYEESYENFEEMTEADWMAFELGRELTAEEIAASERVEAIYEAIDWDEVDDFDYETETEFLEAALGRTLTAEEVADVELIEGLYIELDEMYEEFDYAYEIVFELTPEDIIAEYELVLGRELTDTEKDALNYFYEEIE